MGLLLTYLICSSINVTGILGLIIKALICVVTPNIVFLLAYYRNGRFKEAISFARRLVKKS
jgi:hypothetical protein